MNDIRRTILWVIFGFSMVLLWDQWQVHNGQKPTFFPSTATQNAKPSVNTPALSGSASVPTAAIPSSVAATSSVPGMSPTIPTEQVAGGAKKERLEVSNDVLTLTFDTEGGTLVRTVFANYADTIEKKSGFVLLDESNSRIYVAQSGLIAATGTNLPTQKTVMTALQ